MKELKIGCGKPVPKKEPGHTEDTMETIHKEESVMEVAKVGAKAPDFEAPAYQNGAFGQVGLSDYAGKWVLLCFYPGDFTFV